MKPSADRIESILAAAVEIDSDVERREFVCQACGGDTDLQRHVEQFIENHFRAGGFLESLPHGLAAAAGESFVTERPGTVIGPYKLLEQIGEGGMGLVFMAEQERPVRRKVALKVLKPGMDTRQVVSRFEAERQALALMDHPNIAKMHDAGTTTSGRPYFVMELVRGVPITEFCDQRRLTPRQRLELFVLVCRAVQHVHQKGVIHRDLKPSNVLVTLHDVVAVPKVIDLGIAKATTQRLTEHTLFTHFAQMVGTPLYMSPEQAEMNGLDVDTRSDVYALGVLLYELLTGTTPFESETLKKVGLDEMRRIIREEEPPTPSQRLSTLEAKACSTVSERRGVDERRLRQLLRGELDWIVMKALEKDRNRRYESASALAADVRRYLDDEPVEACPPSAGYRLRKYWRRNRRVLVTAGMFAAVLVAATAVSIWQAVLAHEAQRQAEADRDRAKTAEGQAKVAESRAATEAAISQAVSDFLQRDLLRQVDSDEDAWYTQYPNLTVREALDRAAARIGDRFRDQPLVEAAIRATIGDAYKGLGVSPPAVIQLETALTLRREHLGPDHPDTLETMARLARAYNNVGRFLDLVALDEMVFETKRAKLGPSHDDTLAAMGTLINDYQGAGLWDQALSMAQQVLEKHTVQFGLHHPATIEAMRKVAQVYEGLGRLDEALALFQKALDLYRTTVDVRGSPQVPLLAIPLLDGYAHVCFMAGKLDDAERLKRESLEHVQKQKGIRRRVNTAHEMSHLAAILLKQERFAEAESMARQAQELYETTPNLHSGPNDVRTFYAMSQVGGALLGQKRYAEAEPFLLKGYEGVNQREALIGQGASWMWPTEALRQVIQLYEATNQPEKARQWREKLKEDKSKK
jgi:serine/threonine protein kinase/tetratricopeptide (TPR) repeat protein